MIEDILKDADERMDKTLRALRSELSKIRTGRAHPSLLEHINVTYYGSQVPMNQAANISVLDARTLGVAPWDKNMVGVIEKAILNSDLGLNPVTTGSVMRVPLPALTEERRKELTRVVRSEVEKARVAIRNIRRDANHHLKEMLKEKMITEDEDRREKDKIQKMTDAHIRDIDEILKDKESEIMEI
ncbi:MAG: ribosome recycling factor [Gammaproteobacteria bacterium]|nr:ribosome recycling factor [Gammaproteobacteria bacterium]